MADAGAAAPARPPRSLTRRLLLASLVCLPLYLAATGAFLARSFETSQLAAANERLRVQFYALLSALEVSDDDRVSSNSRSGDPRLAQLNSGLYAVIHRPRGEVLWQSPSSEGLALDNELLAAGEPPAVGIERFEQMAAKPQYLRYQYQTVWEGDDGEDIPLVFTVLEEPTLLQAELLAFLRQLWFWLGGAALLLTVAQAAILRWGLRPLRQLAQDVSDLEQGRRAALPERYPDELQPLATNLNQLLTREQQQRERYRNTLADLAHSLKTPLAVLRLGTAQAQPDRALLDEQIARMDQLIGYQLQRAVTSGARRLGNRVALRPLADKLAATFAKVYFDKGLRLDIDIAADCQIRGDESDLFEVLGNLLDNACKAGRRRVAVGAVPGERWLMLSVEDDGPGVAVDEREHILQRGRRADSYAPGQGIGLAVAMDIIDSYGAELDIGDSGLGGARFTVRWPN
jgi:two-component system sensor histidine kinase PhoQ